MFDIYIYKCKKIYALIFIKYRTFFFKILEFLSLNNLKTSKGLRINQRITIQGRGRVEVGVNTWLGVYPSPGFNRGEFYVEARNETAQIIIGNNVVINNNCTIIADKNSIEIGDFTLIGPNFFCVDSDFHSLDPLQRLTSNYTCQSVKIGKNVFIGAQVMVLKGVSIGDDAVIAAGSIVVNDVPSGVIFGGNPAKFICDLASRL